MMLDDPHNEFSSPLQPALQGGFTTLLPRPGAPLYVVVKTDLDPCDGACALTLHTYPLATRAKRC
jgi:hypothetical protein